MQIYIKILNVGNADAIIIRLTKNEQNLVILLDGGRDTHAGDVKKALNKVLEKAGKAGPDIVICTHFDFDHIGGLLELVNIYKNDIGMFYIHRTGELLLAGSSENGLPGEDDLLIGADSMDISDDYDPGLKMILEGLKHEEQLLGIIDKLGIPNKEPVAGSLQIEGWEEVELIGPSLAYYKELFPEHFEIKELIMLQDDAMITAKANYDPCQALDNLGGNTVSAANLNSAILKIAGDEGVFLFTGDAGIESFYEIQDYQNLLAGIFWLKVPHHGSANNLNSDLIRLMKPKVAAISGGSRVSPLVVNCLQRNCPQIDITSAKGDLEYHYGKP